MSLSREEFRVLDVAAQVNYPVDIFFLDAPNTDEIFNQRRHHGLSTNDLADLLVFMQRQGDLILFPYRVNQFPECDIEDNSPFKAPGLRIIPDYTVIWKDATLYPKKAIIERLAEEKRIYGNNDEYSKFLQERLGVMLLLCLTPQGAEKWEQTAQVDWNKFFECSGRCNWEDTDLSEQQSLMIWRAAALRKETLGRVFRLENPLGQHALFLGNVELPALSNRTDFSLAGDVLEKLPGRFRMRFSGIDALPGGRSHMRGTRHRDAAKRRAMARTSCQVRLVQRLCA